MSNKELIVALKELADAYENALENDFCTGEFPDCEGLLPNEIADVILGKIYELDELESSEDKELDYDGYKCDCGCMGEMDDDE